MPAYTSRIFSKPNGSSLVIATPRQGISLLFSQRLRNLVRDDLFMPLLRTVVIALLVALFLAYWVARCVAAPLQRMGVAARQLAEGKYNRITPEGPHEVQELARAFNEMIDRVQLSQQSQREFIANVSHELKTPITSIQGFAQAIMDGTVHSPNELQQAAEVIYDESGRMHRLILELLDLARFDSGHVKLNIVHLNLRELLERLFTQFYPLARQAQVDMEVKLDGLPTISGDIDRLSLVFSNLIDNAIKHTPPGGQVCLQAGQVDDDYVKVELADTGVGIPTDELGRVFERFYQVDKSRRGDSIRGVGLGLSIAYEIVQAHNGYITVTNNSPQGCIFVVKLPITHRYSFS